MSTKTQRKALLVCLRVVSKGLQGSCIPLALEAWNLSEGVMVTRKLRAVLTTPQRFWQLLQFVCDDETANVWSVTQGRKQETSLLTTGDASSRSRMHSLSFSSPYPSYFPEASICMALTRSVWV